MPSAYFHLLNQNCHGAKLFSNGPSVQKKKWHINILASTIFTQFGKILLFIEASHRIAFALQNWKAYLVHRINGNTKNMQQIEIMMAVLFNHFDHRISRSFTNWSTFQFYFCKTNLLELIAQKAMMLLAFFLSSFFIHRKKRFIFIYFYETLN